MTQLEAQNFGGEAHQLPLPPPLIQHDIQRPLHSEPKRLLCRLKSRFSRGGADTNQSSQTSSADKSSASCSNPDRNRRTTTCTVLLRIVIPDFSVSVPFVPHSVSEYPTTYSMSTAEAS